MESNTLNLKNMVPEVYTNYSKDFQFLCSLYNCVFNSLMYSAQSILNTADTSLAQNNILKLLKSRVGFFSDYHFSDETLREILKAFSYIIKHKGTKTAIEECVKVFLKANHRKISFRVDIQNKDLNGNDLYEVQIGIDDVINNFNVVTLDELLKFVLPTGYIVNYVKYVAPKSTTNVINIEKDNSNSLTSVSVSKSQGEAVVVNLNTRISEEAAATTSDEKFKLQNINTIGSTSITDAKEE